MSSDHVQYEQIVYKSVCVCRNANICLTTQPVEMIYEQKRAVTHQRFTTKEPMMEK